MVMTMKLTELQLPQPLKVLILFRFYNRLKGFLTEGKEVGEESEVEDESIEKINADVSVPTGRAKHSLTWFKQDDSWNVPKGSVLLTLESVYCSSSPLSVVLTDLLAQLLKEILSEYSYYADCAGFLCLSGVCFLLSCVCRFVL